MSNNRTEVFDKEIIENSQEQLTKVAKDLGKQTKRFVKEKQGELEDLANTCADHVKEYPLRSVLLGFAAGALMVKIFSTK